MIKLPTIIICGFASVLMPVTVMAQEATAARTTGVNTWAMEIQRNYPKDELGRPMAGSVAITVSVDLNGRVSDCVVRETSGSKEVDRVACANMTEHARFIPAKDDQGNAIAGSYSTRITYRL